MARPMGARTDSGSQWISSQQGDDDSAHEGGGVNWWGGDDEGGRAGRAVWRPGRL